MRLIDADKAKKSIEQAFLQHRLGTFTIGDVCDCIDNQPTIDAEPVVRCDNCKCSIVNGGDCDSVLVNIRRNYITETNEFVHLYLEYCSNGIKMDEEAKNE